MNNPKSLYMNLLKARVDVQAVLGEMDRLVTSGTSDHKTKALALAPKLLVALNKEKQALGSYIEAIDQSGSSNGATTNTLKRSDFQALSPAKRLAFMRSGGKLRE